MEDFSALDPAICMLEQPETSSEYRSTLMEHYSMDGGPMGIDRAVFGKEYTEFICFVKQHSMLKKCTSLQQLSESMLSRESIVELFPNINKLFVHVLVLPVLTVDCERCFSIIKRVKTIQRNRMSTSTLDSLLRIRIEGPESDFQTAARNWASIQNVDFLTLELLMFL